ncbi:MAG: hypothetical protein V4450_07100 [Bacteroidota bacterium]
MKHSIVLLVLLVAGISAQAQQKLDPKGMNYVVAAKPNSIIYHDTLFSGSRQFKELFYRTGNRDLIFLYDKHQSNKVAGQIIGILGTVATIIGIDRLSSADQKGLGWGLLGGGFAATLTGGYLVVMGQKNLQMAVSLFNQKYGRAAIGIGASNQSAGLVYKF